MNRVSALRLPAVSGLGPGLLASLIIAAAAAFLADHYGGPVMLFALLLGMAMNFLSEVDRCKAGVASRLEPCFGLAWRCSASASRLGKSHLWGGNRSRWSSPPSL